MDKEAHDKKQNLLAITSNLYFPEVPRDSCNRVQITITVRAKIMNMFDWSP